MKILFRILGVFFVVLGVIGAFLPILPTTPFILLAAYLFAKSSPKYEKWIMEHRIFGSIIRDFRNDKSITLHAKIISISSLWISILFSVFFVVNEHLWAQIIMLLIASGVTYHISKYKTKRKS